MARANGIGAATETLAYPSIRRAKTKTTAQTTMRAVLDPLSENY